MREVLAARSDRDFVSGSRRQSRSSGASSGRRLLAAVWQRPGAVLGGFAITTAATAIIVNALGYQSARHPAPMFVKAEPATPLARPEAAPSTLPPVPPTRPVASTATITPAQQPAVRPPARDPIADIIRGSERTGSAPAATRSPEPRPEPQRQVAWAQRALLKLGYGPLKADGIFGQGTRQAIERFERDRRLSPTGELGARTVRELATLSGTRVE